LNDVHIFLDKGRSNAYKLEEIIIKNPEIICLVSRRKLSYIIYPQHIRSYQKRLKLLLGCLVSMRICPVAVPIAPDMNFLMKQSR